MSKLIIDGEHCYNLNRYYSPNLSRRKRETVFRKHKEFIDFIELISNTICKYRITQSRSDGIQHYINFKLKNGNGEALFKIEHLYRLNDQQTAPEEICSGLDFHDLDVENISRLDITFMATIALFFWKYFGRDIFVLRLWDIHDPVMPKCSFFTERLTITGLDVSGRCNPS